MSEYADGIHDALNRMKRAHDRGTGCHLTAEMIASIGISMIAQMWHEPDPREEARAALDSQQGAQP